VVFEKGGRRGAREQGRKEQDENGGTRGHEGITKGDSKSIQILTLLW
jgi:hypothetical protein